MGSDFLLRRQSRGGAAWEPEPLHLPIDIDVPRDRENNRPAGEPDVEESSDLPGSHVIVIDVS